VIKVVVADDQALVRGGFGMILDAQPDVEVVGLAEDGEQAVAMAADHRPDVVLMDIRMPVMDGLEATRAIVADPDASTRVVILTTFDLDEYVYAALASGASGFLLKETRPEVLADAVRTVVGGESLVAPGVLQRLVQRFAPAAPSAEASRLTVLTGREREVLRVVGTGASNSEIAATLHLSESTVKTHLYRIFTKLQLRDRAQAVVLAYESGLMNRP
jgi:DNA-binding NarL/FixJ family response regulator